jgi:hypothetical protein
MEKTKLNIQARLANHVKTNDSSLKRYPNISHQEKDLLRYSITGDICISYGEIILTKSLDSTSDCIDEYLWNLLDSLYIQMPKLLKGESISQEFFDNPETLKFFPDGNEVRVVFECGCKNHVPFQEVKVNLEELISSLLNATKQLIDELLNLNPKLKKNIEVESLIESYNETLDLLVEHDYTSNLIKINN